jgi:hypothetical protein
MLCKAINFLLLTILLATFVAGCDRRHGVEKITLVKVPYQLTQTVNGVSLPVSFGKVKAIDVDSSGHLYVLDAEGCRVSKFDMEGRMLAHWGKEGLGPVEFLHPRAMCVVGDSLLYVFHDSGAEIMDLAGNYRRRVLANAIYDVKVAADGKSSITTRIVL